MAHKKRRDVAKQPRSHEDLVNPLPGITGPKAEKNQATTTGGRTDGLYSDPGDGTIGEVGERELERAVGEAPREHDMTAGTSISPISDVEPGSLHAGTNTDMAGDMPHGPGANVGGSIGGTHVGGMSSGTGRGRGSGTPGGVAGDGDSAGTGGMGGGFDSSVGTGGASGGLRNDIGGGVTGGTGGQGLPRRGDMSGTGGGVAVRGGRGSDVGTVGGGMAPDLDPSTSGGMSGGTFGGSRESDLGGGLSGGTRSGTGADVSGGVGTSDDEAEQGDGQRRPHGKSGA